jgi:two-component system phosphate regulon sensor histidine kinase PhoR
MIRTFALRLAAVYVLLLLAALGVLGLALGAQNETLYDADLHTRLLGEARAVAVAAAPLLARRAALSETQPLAQKLGDGLGARVTLILTDGLVIGDSEQNPLVMDNHSRRPEVQAALLPSPGVGESVRFSNTLKRDLHYLAVPIHAPTEPGRVIGVARVALPNAALDQARTALWANLLGTALVITIPAILLALLFARGISQPLTELRQVAWRIGMGDLGARANGTSRDELGQLAGEINTMADRLADTVRRRTSERNEMAAVLAHLSDGIVVTNAAGEITGINPAAARLFGVTPESALHRSFMQIARDHELYAGLRACLAQPGTSSRVEAGVGRYRVAATFTAVPATDAYGTAGLVVLQDVTELRYLERARRDFVANVSHELRTPLAAIKLLVETLETAVYDDPDAVQPFLQKMQV